MKKPFIRALCITVFLAVGLATQTLRAVDDPETCLSGYITPGGEFVCCDDGGC